jgi:hypothetical protein
MEVLVGLFLFFGESAAVWIWFGAKESKKLTVFIIFGRSS